MLKTALAITFYFGLSFVLFVALAPTYYGVIVYFFFLAPLYKLILLGWWILAWRSRHQTVKLDYRIWGIILMLQGATLVTSPGNCFIGPTPNTLCYSNLQIWFGSAPRIGAGSVPPWSLVENAFFGLVAAYGVALLVALIRGIHAARKSFREAGK